MEGHQDTVGESYDEESPVQRRRNSFRQKKMLAMEDPSTHDLAWVPTLSKCCAEFVMILQEFLFTSMTDAGSNIIEKGEFGDAVVVLKHGKADAILDSEAFQAFRERDVLGLVTVLPKHDAAPLKPVSVRARTVCICLNIKRDTISHLLKRFPDDKAHLVQEASREVADLIEKGNINIGDQVGEWRRPIEKSASVPGPGQPGERTSMLWGKVRNLTVAVNAMKGTRVFNRRNSAPGMSSDGAPERLSEPMPHLAPGTPDRSDRRQSVPGMSSDGAPERFSEPMPHGESSSSTCAAGASLAETRVGGKRRHSDAKSRLGPSGTLGNRIDSEEPDSPFHERKSAPERREVRKLLTSPAGATSSILGGLSSQIAKDFGQDSGSSSPYVSERTGPDDSVPCGSGSPLFCPSASMIEDGLSRHAQGRSPRQALLAPLQLAHTREAADEPQSSRSFSAASRTWEDGLALPPEPKTARSCEVRPPTLARPSRPARPQINSSTRATMPGGRTAGSDILELRSSINNSWDTNLPDVSTTHRQNRAATTSSTVSPFAVSLVSPQGSQSGAGGSIRGRRRLPTIAVDASTRSINGAAERNTRLLDDSPSSSGSPRSSKSPRGSKSPAGDSRSLPSRSSLGSTQEGEHLLSLRTLK